MSFNIERMWRLNLCGGRPKNAKACLVLYRKGMRHVQQINTKSHETKKKEYIQQFPRSPYLIPSTPFPDLLRIPRIDALLSNYNFENLHFWLGKSTTRKRREPLFSSLIGDSPTRIYRQNKHPLVTYYLFCQQNYPCGMKEMMAPLANTRLVDAILSSIIDDSKRTNNKHGLALFCFRNLLSGPHAGFREEEKNRVSFVKLASLCRRRRQQFISLVKTQQWEKKTTAAPYCGGGAVAFLGTYIRSIHPAEPYVYSRRGGRKKNAREE